MTVRTAPAVAAAALAFALPASAAQGPTLAATPTTVGALSAVALSGTGGSGKAGAAVFVEAKECNASFYRVVAGTTTSVGGSWSTNAPVQRTTTFRARIGGAHSNTVVVRKRAVVALARSKTPGGRRLFVASVHSGWDLAGRPIRLERYTASGWVLVAQKKLQRNAVWGETQATFRIRRSALRLRAYVPLTSARPCFVAAASSIIRS